MPRPKATLTLPLPISKNRRVQIASRNVWKGHGFVRKPVVVNTKKWGAYIEEVDRILSAYMPFKFSHPKEDERIVLECEWFLPSSRSDCVNGHDVLADAVGRSIGIDDKWILIRDKWSSVDKANPRVVATFWMEKKPASP